MQRYFLIMNLIDAIKEGDIITNVILKLLIPFFYSHSALSKYMVECVDYILKTEVILSPQLSLRVRAGSFVNTKGGRGNNKAADMVKENQVKMLKNLIGGLGSNKTDNAIVTISKAAPVIDSIVENFDSIVKLKDITTTHKKREMLGDINVIINCLKDKQLWTQTPGRKLIGFKKMPKSPFTFSRQLFKGEVMNVVNRLKRGLPFLDSTSDS